MGFNEDVIELAKEVVKEGLEDDTVRILSDLLEENGYFWLSRAVCGWIGWGERLSQGNNVKEQEVRAGTSGVFVNWAPSWISREIAGEPFIKNRDLGIQGGVYINPGELNSLREAYQERMKAVKVDSFKCEIEYRGANLHQS